VAGLEPREFRWVIARRLAVSERIGGYGYQHRRVRREEEIIWLRERGVNTMVSLLAGGQNLGVYEAAGLDVEHMPIEDVLEPTDTKRVFAAIDRALAKPGAVALIHRDIIDDTVAGILAGYLIHAGILVDPIVATSVIQEITGRPLGPEGRRLIPLRT
jgi:hypothetical protein